MLTFYIKQLSTKLFWHDRKPYLSNNILFDVIKCSEVSPLMDTNKF